jgi:hypothetical protein
MNLDLVISILILALSLLRGQTTGRVKSDSGLARTLLRIARLAAREYEDRVGQPIDLSLIKPEAGI